MFVRARDAERGQRTASELGAVFLEMTRRAAQALQQPPNRSGESTGDST